jgi:hypothetical protein
MISDPKKLRAAMTIANAVLTKAVAVVLGFWGGHLLDLKYHTDPYLMFLCGVGAMGLGIWYLLWVLKKVQR